MSVNAQHAIHEVLYTHGAHTVTHLMGLYRTSWCSAPHELVTPLVYNTTHAHLMKLYTSCVLGCPSVHILRLEIMYAHLCYQISQALQ